MNQRSCLSPDKRMNQCGAVLRKFRMEAGLTQNDLVACFQREAWDLDRVVIVRIEAGTRTLLDYEVGFVLWVLGRTWHDHARELE